MQALVNKIIPFSSVDGPGNRTAVFFQGCNIDCKYCHNPETRKICIGCGECVSHCQAGALSFGKDDACITNIRTRAGMKKTKAPSVIFDPKKCVRCDTCIHICPHDSSPRTIAMTPDEVYDEVKKQLPFIRGLSVSGGECMLWPDFIYALFSLAKKDALSTLIDSNGTIPFWDYPDLMNVCDGVMLDIKAFDNGDHKRITGASNETVLKNAVYLAKSGKLYEVRAVIVPDLYDGEKSVSAIGDFLLPYLRFHDIRIKVISFRPMGVRKQYAHFKVPKRDYLEKLKNILVGKGFINTVVI